MNSLAKSIQAARVKAGLNNKTALSKAKREMEEAIVESIGNGEDAFTFQSPSLSPHWRADFESWMRAAGVQFELVHDFRDGDYYQIKGLLG